MRAFATGSLYTLKLSFTVLAFIAMALPLAHFNSTMHGLGGGQWDQMLASFSQEEDLIVRPIAKLFGVNPHTELFLWIKALIPIDFALLLWILPDSVSRSADSDFDSD